MADDQSITMYKDGRDPIQVSTAAYKEAVSKGWSKDKPTKTAPSKPTASPTDTPFTKPGFMAGFGAGINPFHQAPANMPVPGTMGPVGRGAADMVNMREIFNRATTGDTSGAVGQGLGTAAGLAGPELLKGAGKGLKAAGVSMRSMEEIPALAKAAQYATQTAKSLRVSPDAARFAEHYVMPLREAVDRFFAPVHKMLEKEIIPANATMQQLFKRLQKSEIPSVYKVGEELAKRTAFDYREAEELRRSLMKMIGGDAEHWSPQIRKLAEEMDSEIQKVAAKKGVGAARTELRSLNGQIERLVDAAATTAKTKSGVLRGTAAAGVGRLGGEAGQGLAATIRAGQETTMKASPIVEAEAKRLAKKLAVDPARFSQGTKSIEKLGTAMKTVGRGAQAAEVGGAGRRAYSGANSSQ